MFLPWKYERNLRWFMYHLVLPQIQDHFSNEMRDVTQNCLWKKIVQMLPFSSSSIPFFFTGSLLGFELFCKKKAHLSFLCVPSHSLEILQHDTNVRGELFVRRLQVEKMPSGVGRNYGEILAKWHLQAKICNWNWLKRNNGGRECVPWGWNNTMGENCTIFPFNITFYFFLLVFILIFISSFFVVNDTMGSFLSFFLLSFF